MPALCPECGTVHPQENAGTAALTCPQCGRSLLVEPIEWGDAYASPAPAAPAAPAAAETPAPASPHGYPPRPQGWAPGYPPHGQAPAPHPGAYTGYPQAPGVPYAGASHGYPQYAQPPAQWPGAYPGYPPYTHAPAPPPPHLFNRPEFLAQQYDGTIAVKRWAASVVDHLALGAAGVLLFLGADAVGGEGPAGVVVIGWVIVSLAYFPVLEGLYGATLGKRALRLRVVDRDGNLPGLLKAGVRTLLRLVEYNPFFMLGGLIAGILVLTTRAHQRLGDMAAGTYVLTEDDAARAGAGGSVPQGWSWNASLRRGGRP